ncbi:MAG: SAM-dependent chlorinase/fluorinase, partial [Anaerolineae bacterium]|nr:SAM-dependent chlorinase/fluorinase [Anaerolineae bacterium]
AAAHLANGVPITELGSSLPELIKLPDPALEITPGHIRGEVLHIDHFGNIITSIGYLAWSGDGTLELDPQFGARQPETIWLHPEQCRLRIGIPPRRSGPPTARRLPARPRCWSAGQLEIGVNQGSAAQTLGAALGDPVMLIAKS